MMRMRGTALDNCLDQYRSCWRCCQSRSGSAADVVVEKDSSLLDCVMIFQKRKVEMQTTVKVLYSCQHSHVDSVAVDAVPVAMTKRGWNIVFCWWMMIRFLLLVGRIYYCEVGAVDDDVGGGSAAAAAVNMNCRSVVGLYYHGCDC